jgi:Chaperone of endosialidase
MGSTNTAVGNFALLSNVTGNNNTAIGASALSGTTGSDNIGVGFQAGAFVGSSGNVIAIGSPGDDVDNSCFIGNIRDVQTHNADAIAVVVDSAGQLGTASSSARFKKEIKQMDKASEAILALKPVTFHYRSDETSTPQFGLIAEEVAKVNPDLVVRDKKGEIYTVRYDAVNAMLLNEFLKSHRKMEEQQAMIEQLEKQIETLTAGLQKVSAQLEASKPTPQVVNNP